MLDLDLYEYVDFKIYLQPTSFVISEVPNLKYHVNP